MLAAGPCPWEGLLCLAVQFSGVECDCILSVLSLMPMSGSVGDVADLSDHVEAYLRGFWVSHGMAGHSPECVLGLSLKHHHGSPCVKLGHSTLSLELQAKRRGLTPFLKLSC